MRMNCKNILIPFSRLAKAQKNAGWMRDRQLRIFFTHSFFKIPKTVNFTGQHNWWYDISIVSYTSHLKNTI
jgi:hypothetical protein